MRIAITGATGHIGNTLVKLLYEQEQYQLRACYRDSKKAYIFNKMNIEHYCGDVLDIYYLNKAFQNIDAVIHLAAKISIEGDPDGSVKRTNVEGVINIVNACRTSGVKKLIHISSIHALDYNQKNGFVNESTGLVNKDHNSYDYSKALGEEAVVRAIQEGLDAYIVYPTGVIGPNDYFDSLVGSFLRKLFAGKMFAIINGGFDWVDVRDVCFGIRKILEKEINSDRKPVLRKYILSGQFAEFSKIARLASEISGRNLKPWIINKQFALLFLPFVKLIANLFGVAPLFTKESLETILQTDPHFSSEKAYQELSYVQRSLEISLKDCYEWYTANDKI